MVTRRMGMMRVQQEVMEASEERCKTEVKPLRVEIERGTPEGHVVTFERVSEQASGTLPGDVRLQLSTAPHAAFTRSGDDLEMQLHVPLRQALLGFEKQVRHLDGHAVLVRNEAVSSHGQVLVLPGEGMPKHGTPSEFGDLRVELIIKFPSAITRAERAFVAQNFEPPREGHRVKAL